MAVNPGSNTLTDAAFAKVRDATNRVLASGAKQGGYGGAAVPPSNNWYWAKVSSGSSITAGTLDTPTTFTFDVWLPSTTSVGGAFAVSADSTQLAVTGYNRSAMTASAGDMFKVEFANGEWTPKSPSAVSQIVEGELTATLSAASNARSGATTCTAQAYVVSTPASGSTPAVMALSGNNVLVVNRSLSMSGTTGTLAFWTQTGTELLLVGVDC